MAYPTPHSSGHTSAAHAAGAHAIPSAAVTSSVGHASGPARRPARGSSCEGDHQLEKLEFALAVALTRGDQSRSQQLREAIAALGGNAEEPGT